MDFRIASEKDLEIIWNKNIKRHPNDDRWKRWKDEYIGYNVSGKATTFVVANNEDVVGEITILFSPECKPVYQKKQLCDAKTIANLNAFRIEKKFEGKGYISKLLKIVEIYAKEKGYKELSIGVDAKETRNLAIYLHWGYNNFIFGEIDKDDNELVLYYKKQI